MNFKFRITITIIISALIIFSATYSNKPNESTMGTKASPGDFTVPTHIDRIANFANGSSKFSDPRGIATNGTHWFVVDQSINQVKIVTRNGDVIKSFGGLGNGTGQFNYPIDIDVNQTNVFVVDALNDRIEIFDFEGNYVAEFGSTGTGAGQFMTPAGIFIYQGLIYVTDLNNGRLEIFDSSFTRVGTYGTFGTGQNQLSNPSDVYVTATRVYIVESSPARIKVLDNNLNFISHITSPLISPFSAIVWNSYLVISDLGLGLYFYSLDASIPFGSGYSDWIYGTYTLQYAALNGTHLWITSDKGIEIWGYSDFPRYFQVFGNQMNNLLIWDDLLFNQTFANSQFNVYKGNSPATLSYLDSTYSFSYFDQPVTSGETIYYAVTATTSLGETDYSPILSVSGSQTETTYVTIPGGTGTVTRTATITVTDGGNNTVTITNNFATTNSGQTGETTVTETTTVSSSGNLGSIWLLPVTLMSLVLSTSRRKFQK